MKSRIKLSTKLICSFVAVAAITAVVGVIGWFGLQKVAREMEATTDKIKQRRSFLAKAVDCARSAQVSFKVQVQEWKNVLLRGSDPAAFEKHWKGFEKEEVETARSLAALEELMRKEGLAVTNVQAAARSLGELGTQYREALKTYQGTNSTSALAVDKLVRGIDRPPTEAIEAIVAMVNAFESENTTGDQRRLRRDKARIELLTIALVGVGVVMAMVLGISLSLSVSRQIRGVARTLQASAAEVTAAAGHINTASQTLAEGATEQAASLEETSASLEEMASMTRRNAENAGRANELAAQARTAADTGSREMTAMTQAMQDIKSSSNDIAKIIKVIDEIAFQTNILALNAAVEAARAGEAGMGFAVVADEVRNLAQRSAQAARQTADQIETAISKTALGVTISEKVASSLTEIVNKARQVDELACEVATASKEQSQGISQINQALTQMDKVTQNTAASAEESASAAQELNSQSISLEQATRDLLELVGGAGDRPDALPQATSRFSTSSDVGPAFQRPKLNEPQTSDLSKSF